MATAEEIQQANIEKVVKALQGEFDLVTSIEKEVKKLGALREKETTELLAQQSALEKIQEMEEQAEKGERDKVTSLEKAAIKREEQTKFMKQDLDTLNEQIKARQLILDIADKGGVKDKEIAKILVDNGKRYEEELKLLKKEFDQKQKTYILEKQREKAAKLAEESVKTFGGLLGIASEVNDTWLGKLENTFKSTKSIQGALEGVTKGMVETFTPTKIFESSVSKVVESTIFMAKEMDTSLASFNKATGAGGKYNQVIDDVRFSSMAAGVGLKESTEAVQALFEGFTQFTQLNQETQIEVSRTTAELDRMGISSKTTAQALDIGTKALGMNINEAMDAEKQIAATALELGVSPGKLADDFVHTLPKLAQYGKQSTQIFKELAVQSKATGISVDGLINISQQFDTFEGAAQAAGKLNAILGGNLLNSSELLTASESERIDMLRQSISLSGRNFNELSKFEKMSIASAAGIKDMNEAARLFGTSDAEFDKVRKAQDAEALSTEAIKNAAASATSVQEKMNLIMQAFSGAALPALNIATKIVNTFLQLSDTLGGWLAPALVGVTGGLYLMSKAFGILKAIQEAVVAISGLFAGSIETEVAAEEANAAAKTENTIATKAQTEATVEKEAAIGLNTAALAEEELAEIADSGAKLENVAATEAAVIAAEEQAVAENAGILSKLRSAAATTAQTVWTAIKEAADWAATAALLAYSTAEEAVVTAKESNILTTIKENAVTAAGIVWDGIKAVGLAVLEAATFAYSVAEELLITIKEQGVLATIGSIAANVWDATVKGVATIATFALSAATWIATAATTAFGIAVLIATSPIGLIVLGILALIAAFVAIIVYFDDISNWLSNLTGGFFDLWDVILIGIPFIGWGIELWRNWDNIVDLFSGTLSTVGDVFTGLWEMLINGFKSINAGIQNLTGGFLDIYDVVLILAGPFGWFIEIGKKIYENWETIISGIKGLFQSLADTVSSIFDGIWNTLKAPLNIGISTINSVISKANVIPGVEIPPIPELADGATNFAGGMALVGERGPELVTMPQGTNVLTNENTNTLSAAGSALSKTRAEQTGRQTNAMERTANTQEKAQAGGEGAADNGNRTLILELDGREFGRAVVNVFDKKMKLNMTGA